MHDYYDELGVDSTATPAEIRAAFRRIAQLLHPDRHQQEREEVRKEAERRIKLVNQAYGVLSDPTRRKAYDDERADDTRRGGSPGELRVSPTEFRLVLDSAGFGDVKANVDVVGAPPGSDGAIDVECLDSRFEPVGLKLTPIFEGSSYPATVVVRGRTRRTSAAELRITLTYRAGGYSCEQRVIIPAIHPSAEGPARGGLSGPWGCLSFLVLLSIIFGVPFWYLPRGSAWLAEVSLIFLLFALWRWRNSS